jgi:hypothetical protein
MFLKYIPYCCSGYILLSLVLWAFAGYAYRVNAGLPVDDPKKKNYHPAAVYLVPFTWSAFLVAYILLFILKALLYGIFLIVFTIALVAIRKPFILAWLDRIARKIGNMLLEANTFLARQLFPQPA